MDLRQTKELREKFWKCGNERTYPIQEMEKRKWKTAKGRKSGGGGDGVEDSRPMKSINWLMCQLQWYMFMSY